MNKKSTRMLRLHSFVAIFWILAMMFSITSVMAQETIVSVIDPEDGDDTVELDADTAVGTTFLFNVTIEDAETLAGWQINVTYDPRLLSIAAATDVFTPADHIFNGLDPKCVAVDINNDVGYMVWGCAIGPAAPVDNITGSGTMCQIRFTTMKNGTGEPTACEIVLDREGLFATTLVDPWAEYLSFDTEKGYYFIPEFPMTALLITFLIITTAAAVLTKKAWSTRARKTT